MLGEILTAIVTPFARDGSVDLARFRELARHLVENGSDGRGRHGHDGREPDVFRRRALRALRRCRGGGGRPGDRRGRTGTNATAHSVHLTERTHELGVDGFLVVTPYYNRPPPRGIVAHFEAVAAVTDKPVVVYNIPARRDESRDRDARSWPRSRTCRRSSRRTTTSRRRSTSSSSVSISMRATTIWSCRSRKLGGVGGVCVHTHVVGPQVKEVVRRFRAGDAAGARELDEQLRPSIDLLRVAPNPIAIKAALNILGHEVGGHRLPLVEATHDERDRVRACLDRLGLLQHAAV